MVLAATTLAVALATVRERMTGPPSNSLSDQRMAALTSSTNLVLPDLAALSLTGNSRSVVLPPKGGDSILASLPVRWVVLRTSDATIYEPVDDTRGVAVIVRVEDIDASLSPEQNVTAMLAIWIDHHQDAETVDVAHGTIAGHPSTDVRLQLPNQDSAATRVDFHFVETASRLYMIERATDPGADPAAISEADELIDSFSIEPSNG